MKVRSARIQTSPKLMIIPLIDIIFFLLVFFMVSSLHMVYQKTLPVNLPKSSTAQSDVTKPLSITLHKDGSINIGHEVVSEKNFLGKVKATLADNPQLPVIIRADEKTEHGQVIKVMDSLKTAGVSKLAIATETKGP